jgi:isoleucyl-tRNA synthetase
VRQVLLPLWNVWYFFSLYANASGHVASLRTDSSHLLDRYILAKTGELVADVRRQMDEYDISGAAASVRSYLDALTNWYVRRSRDRFWAGDADAFDTLATVLETLCRVVAPLAPLTTEEIWRGLTGERSVHLTDWPSAERFPADHELVASMDAIRDAASAALSLRKARGLRVRLPLARLTVATADAGALAGFGDLLSDEVNVKEVVFAEDVAAYCEQVLTVVPRALGPRVGKQVQQVIQAVKKGDWQLVDGAPVAAGVALLEGEYELKLVAADAENSAPLPAGAGVVVLDTVVTAELEAEGLARDVIRVVQQARRAADLDVSDRVRLEVVAPAGVVPAVETHADFVKGETLATDLVITPAADGFEGLDGFEGEVGDGQKVAVVVRRTV